MADELLHGFIAPIRINDLQLVVAVQKHRSGLTPGPVGKLCRCSMRGQVQSLVQLRRRDPIRRHAFQHLARDAERFEASSKGTRAPTLPS